MISARNKIKSTVTEVKNGAVNAVVKLDAGNGINLSAVITMDSVNELGLSAGKTCYATIKASEVMISNEKLKISARNQLRGTITKINEGIAQIDDGINRNKGCDQTQKNLGYGHSSVD